MKKIISACIKQVVQFDSKEELNSYMTGLRFKKIPFLITDQRETPDGKVTVIICKGYNGNDLLTT